MAPPDEPDDDVPALAAEPAVAPADAPAAAPSPAPPPEDQTVKELLDAATIADLERWFGLPSFQALAEREPEPDDPELEAARERFARAIEAVDPAMVEAHRRRVESGDSLIQFQATIELRIDPSLARLDMDMIERKQLATEPREIEIPDALRDDLRDCTPQAILRDLHRPEELFDKLFEVVDMAAEQRLDIVAAVAEAMRTSWKLPPLEASPATQVRALAAELREDRMRDIAHFLPNLPNRRVTE